MQLIHGECYFSMKNETIKLRCMHTGDNDGDRRDAVKRKTAQYLQRAEQLVARLTRRDKKREQVITHYSLLSFKNLELFTTSNSQYHSNQIFQIYMLSLCIFQNHISFIGS